MNYIEITNFPELQYAPSEAFNTLATNIFYCGTNIKTIMLTSRYSGEGKSYSAMNLMRTLAGLNKRVVLVDTDLRRSSLAGRYHFRYSVPQPMGFAQYLAGMCNIGDIVYETNIENAHIIPIGRTVTSSLQLLSSSRMETLFECLNDIYDVVIVDTPPVGLIVDAVEISKYCDGALIVVEYNRGKKQEIADIKYSIEKSGCKVLGAVLNNVDFDAFSNRKYYYKSEYYNSYYTKASHKQTAESGKKRKH